MSTKRQFRCLPSVAIKHCRRYQSTCPASSLVQDHSVCKKVKRHESKLFLPCMYLANCFVLFRKKLHQITAVTEAAHCQQEASLHQTSAHSSDSWCRDNVASCSVSNAFRNLFQSISWLKRPAQWTPAMKSNPTGRTLDICIGAPPAAIHSLLVRSLGSINKPPASAFTHQWDPQFEPEFDRTPESL